MYVTELRTNFETLERMMDLPANVKVVAIQEEDIKGCFKIRMCSITPPPEECTFADLSSIGDAYRHPEKYNGNSPSKASTSEPEAA